MALKPVTSKSKGAAQAKRRVKKHQSVHKRLRIKILLAPLFRLIGRLPKTIRLPGIDSDVATFHVVGFLMVVGIALGAGYWGAKSMFGPHTQPEPSVNPVASSPIIRQSLDYAEVILPEPVDPKDKFAHKGRAYEEKVAEDIYVPTDLGKAPSQASPSTPDQVASLTPSTEPIPPQPLWAKNAIDFKAPKNKPMIALVIDDMGVDRKRSKRMWEDVPGPVTLSFMSYANDLPEQTRAAQSKGHELMLHMSMEPSNPNIDAGPNVLRTAMPDDELIKLTNWGLDRFQGYIGVNNHMGSRFTENSHAMKVVLQQVKDRGLLFLDSRTSPKSVGVKVAKGLKMPVLVRNVFLDNDNEIDKVLKQLAEVERVARKRGMAIAIGHPREATIEVLKTWVPEALNRGLAIVPLSTIMKSTITKKRLAAKSN